MCCLANKKITLSVISSSCSRQSVPEKLKNCRSHFGLAGKIQPGMMGSMEQYYITTEDGKTEGPYLFESLETFYKHGKITKDTLVCIAGGQEWVQFGTVLEQKWKEKSEKNSLQKKQERTEATSTDVELIPTVEGLFQIMGILALLAGVILALCNTGPGYAAIGIIYLLSGAFSCLGCFWCAKVIKLLSCTVDLLSVIAKRVYNSGNSTDKQ